MDKLGWQVVAAVTGSLWLITAAAAWNNARSVDVANHQIRERPEAPCDQIDTHAPMSVIEHHETPIGHRVLIDPNDRCIDGQLFRKVRAEWVQLGPC